MASQRKPASQQPELKKPENFDLEKGFEIAVRIARRNAAWVKEMAKK